MNSQESIIELKKYLKKLYLLIDNDAIFHLIKTKIVDKKKADDILCCVEASWPNEYKAYLDKYGITKLQSNKYYFQLLNSIKNRFLLSTNVYAVRYAEALRLINCILNTVDFDMNMVYREQSGEF